MSYKQHLKSRIDRPRMSGRLCKPYYADRRQVTLANLCGLVSQQGVLGCVLTVAASLEFCQVPVVVTLHLQVKHLRLARGGSGDKVIVQQLQDAGAYVAQLLLYLQGMVTKLTSLDCWCE